ncbi:MAG TPA: ATPase, T2SS/T4P/T4SS family [Actinomycetota bacterium]|nr:ATPase, T2SS/T4P/T4SS family [Actinomycetota bacterium]
MDRRLLELVCDNDGLAELDPAHRRLQLRDLVAAAHPEMDVGSSVEELSNWIDGFGPLTHLMEDPDVSDILVNGVDEVWVERGGSLERQQLRFASRDELAHLIERLLGSSGGRADAAKPIGDARLADGSRIHVVLPPVAPAGPLVSIRRVPRRPWSLDDLVARELLTDRQAEVLRGAVLARRTIVIAGSTGAGKTTLANALLGCVPAVERVVIIEETPELRPSCTHWISLVAREASAEGVGALDQSALLRAALRMRPDRIVVGEVRGSEVAVALHAIATGHAGSLVTVHAGAASEVCDRLVELALMDPAMREDVARRQVERSIDVVVHLKRRAGHREVAEIIERDRDV